MLRPELEQTRMLKCKIAPQFVNRWSPGPISGKKLADNETEVIKFANASKSSLSENSIWTQDLEMVAELLLMTGSNTAASNNVVVIMQAGVNFGDMKDCGSGIELSSCCVLAPVDIKSTVFYYQLVPGQSVHGVKIHYAFYRRQ